eukprot:32044-Prymnesium_polylepis.3
MRRSKSLQLRCRSSDRLLRAGSRWRQSPPSKRSKWLAMQAPLLPGRSSCVRVGRAFVTYSFGGGGEDATVAEATARACPGPSIRVTAVASGSGTERTAAMSSILPCTGGKQRS